MAMVQVFKEEKIENSYKQYSTTLGFKDKGDLIIRDCDKKLMPL